MKNKTQIISTSKAPSPVGAYPHARRVGDLLFLSGIGPRDAKTNQVPGTKVDEHGKIVAYDIEMQCHSVFANVREVLEASGSDWEQLIDVVVFLTDIDRDFSRFNTLWAQYFKGNQPCRTTVEVNKLPTPIAIELKCIATLK